MANSKPKVIFEPVEMMIGVGWYVRVTLPKGRQPQLGGFNTEAEAVSWIKRESADWLKGFEGGKYA